MEKKNYSRPMMAVETFVPNQFIAACYKWELNLVCTGGSNSGMHYVFPGVDETAVGNVYHAGHTMTYYLWTETDQEPSGAQLEEFYRSIGEFNAYLANDESTYGNPNNRRFQMKADSGDYLVGYAWMTGTNPNEDMHFVEGEMRWVKVHEGTGSTPNAS